MESKRLKITLRHSKVPTDKAKSALVKFFKTWQVCPQCHGAGYFDKRRKAENEVPEYSSIYYGDLEDAQLIVENLDNSSLELKDIIYRETGIRSDCPCCNGEKYVRRTGKIKVD